MYNIRMHCLQGNVYLIVLQKVILTIVGSRLTEVAMNCKLSSVIMHKLHELPSQQFIIERKYSNYPSKKFYSNLENITTKTMSNR